MSQSVESLSPCANSSFKKSASYCCSTLVSTVVLASALLVNPAEASDDYAPVVPKALKSTLIDVEQAGSRLVAVGERGHVLYSDDSAESWQQAKVPFIRMLTGVSFIDDKRGWAVGHQSMVFQTSDGGETWARQLDGFSFQALANEEDLERTRGAYEALAAELEENPDESRELDLEDALFAFEDAEYLLEEPVVPTNLHDVWFLDENTGWAVGSFGRLIETRDGGKTWVNKSHLVKTFDGFHLNSITGTADGQIYIAGEGGVINRSMDAGQTWEQLDAGYYGSFFGITYDPTNELLIAFGLGSALYQSSDFGLTWQSMSSPIDATFAGGTVTEDGNTVLVGPAGVVLVIDGADSSMQPYPQASRRNHSTVLSLGDGEYVLVGAGGANRVKLN